MEYNEVLLGDINYFLFFPFASFRLVTLASFHMPKTSSATSTLVFVELQKGLNCLFALNTKEKLYY